MELLTDIVDIKMQMGIRSLLNDFIKDFGRVEINRL